MRPEDVPLHLVRIALAAIPRDQFGAKADWMRHALAAVLPLAVAEEREACAKVATSDLRSVAKLCPYITDKPGDPTWLHTDADVCPVCRKSGDDTIGFCTAYVGGRIATAIRSRGEPR